MPERWERELDKLSFVDAPASTRARVTAGPRGDEMPPSPRGGQRVAAGVVAFVVFGAAAALAAGALRSPATTPEGSPDATANAVQSTPPSGGPILTATLEAPRDGSMPELVLTYGGRTDSFLATDGEWPGVQGFPLPIQIFEGSLDPGATISVESDAQSIEARLLVADQNQRMTGDPIPIDLSSGTQRRRVLPAEPHRDVGAGQRRILRRHHDRNTDRGGTTSVRHQRRGPGCDRSRRT